MCREILFAWYLKVILDTVLRGHASSGVGVGLEVAPLLQHEGSLCGELHLAGSAAGQDTDAVVLV